ncbi:MAG: amidinotransferase [Planctomycetes bacterium]|nr:amidinotransferase [Planctomycetota bacterium]
MARVITSAAEVPAAIQAAAERPPCRRVLMASPKHFKVESALNPWMRDERGALNQVDTTRAREQWRALRAAYERIAIRVEVIDAPVGLPDFCFAANQSLALPGVVVLSRMASEERRREVPYFEHWYRQHGYQLLNLPPEIERFEGTGDAILHPSLKLIWGGVGPRTEEAAWQFITRETDTDVIALRLTDPRFYHLDTCLCLLDDRSALWIPAAFDETSRAMIEAGFNRLHAVSEADAANFACNAHCPDARHVLLQQGSAETVEWLKGAGFVPLELDTSEFMKSGGSVFCLKQELP